MNISALVIGKVSAINRKEKHNASNKSGEVTLTLWSALKCILLIRCLVFWSKFHALQNVINFQFWTWSILSGTQNPSLFSSCFPLLFFVLGLVGSLRESFCSIYNSWLPQCWSLVITDPRVSENPPKMFDFYHCHWLERPPTQIEKVPPYEFLCKTI